jgi:hypothetical protein
MAIGAEVLNLLTTYWIGNLVARKTSTYGAVGIALAVLFWVYILGWIMVASAGLNAGLWYRRDQPLGPADRAHSAIPPADQHNTARLSVPSSQCGLWPPTAAFTGEGPKPRLPRIPTVDDGSVGDDVVQRATITPQQDAKEA